VEAAMGLGDIQIRCIEEVAPEDLGWIDIILNGQI
jgi:hypothetical protein